MGAIGFDRDHRGKNSGSRFHISLNNGKTLIAENKQLALAA
jgi:hypothetical protein